MTKNEETAECLTWTKEQTYALYYYGTVPDGFEYMHETRAIPWDRCSRSLHLVRRVSDGKVFALSVDHTSDESDCDRFLYEVHSQEKTVRVWYLGPEGVDKTNALEDLPDASILHEAPCVW